MFEESSSRAFCLIGEQSVGCVLSVAASEFVEADPEAGDELHAALTKRKERRNCFMLGKLAAARSTALFGADDSVSVVFDGPTTALDDAAMPSTPRRIWLTDWRPRAMATPPSAA